MTESPSSKSLHGKSCINNWARGDAITRDVVRYGKSEQSVVLNTRDNKVERKPIKTALFLIAIYRI